MPTIAVVTDLIFSTKITGTAKALGKPISAARTLDKLREQLDALAAVSESSATKPTVIIDLNIANADPIAFITLAKQHRTAPHIIAFLSHVQVELAQAAREAGADQVLARSGFVDQLPQILQQA